MDTSCDPLVADMFCFVMRETSFLSLSDKNAT